MNDAMIKMLEGAAKTFIKEMSDMELGALLSMFQKLKDDGAISAEYLNDLLTVLCKLDPTVLDRARALIDNYKTKN